MRVRCQARMRGDIEEERRDRGQLGGSIVSPFVKQGWVERGAEERVDTARKWGIHVGSERCLCDRLRDKGHDLVV